MDLYLEITAVLFGILYLIFLIKEQIICWLFGIISSLVSIFLFYKTGLYSESILYIYYVIIGIYGYILWSKKQNGKVKELIKNMPFLNYVYLIILGAFLSYGLGYYFANYTDAKSPYLDASTTIFSFIASYLEAKKYISAWHFWIIINLVTIGLYLNRGLELYTGLTFIYVIFSFVGLYQWRKKLKASSSFTV